MVRPARKALWFSFLVAATTLALAPSFAVAAPVDSDLAAAQDGGGCYPTGLHPALFDMLTLVDPEWAPLLNGPVVDSAPVLIHGVVNGMHGDTGGDFPATHLRADVNYFIRLDPEDAGRLATGNDDGLLHLEWEAGVYPAFAWAGPGDRVVALGRWIFDCGHPNPTPGACSQTLAQACVVDSDCAPPSCPTCASGETCKGTRFGYSSELHPPYATAVIRTGGGAPIPHRHHHRAVPVTRADVYVSGAAGGAGDRCILTHRSNPLALLATECFPLAQPVAELNSQDFVFELPLPPRPHGGKLAVRTEQLPPPGGVPAHLEIIPQIENSKPHLDVRVVLTKRASDPDDPLPTGFAGKIWAGWRNDPTALTHVRVTLKEVTIRNALQPATPVSPKMCASSAQPCGTSADCGSGDQCLGVGPVKAWHLQASVNGQWKELSGFDSVNTGDVVPLGVVYDEYLPREDGALHLVLNGAARECISTMYGKSIRTDIRELGLGEGIQCLNSIEHSPGQIDVQYSGPDFGARHDDEAEFDAVSVGGEGGSCSGSPASICVVDPDCPASQTCVQKGGAMLLRYRIERFSR